MKRAYRNMVITLVIVALSAASGAAAGKIYRLDLEADGVDLTRLPIGDGRVSNSARVGYVWSCQSSFNGTGAQQSGPWIRSDGTFDLTAKAVVDGEVAWPTSFTILVQGDKRVLTGNGLPNHVTGEYPIKRTDDAYQYDRNPNSIRAQNLRIELPATPALAAQPSCVPMGAIGVLVTGGVFFNALDAAGRDGVAHEIQDQCQGHPERSGSYHYHNLTNCLDKESETQHSKLVGYAFDGFGIYGFRGESGKVLTNADLDECHGHTHQVEWDGKMVTMYHYHATHEYPYTLGCYRGTAIRTGGMSQPGGQTGSPPASATPMPTATPATQENGAPAVTVPGSGSRTFTETGKVVSGLFLDYWNNNGALARQGYPISSAMSEASDLDGKTYTVQYFERAVFEYHPENKAPYDVLLSQLGTFQYKKKYPAGAPNQQPNNTPGSMTFSQTGKRLGGKFLDYWKAQGGVQQFGYPLSDEFMEKSDLDGKTYLVQYFERAVFEYHPENAGTPYEVLLSQLGTARYKEKHR